MLTIMACCLWYVSLQRGQAGGRRALFHGARGQPEACRLRPDQPLRWWPPRPREEKVPEVSAT